MPNYYKTKQIARKEAYKAIYSENPLRHWDGRTNAALTTVDWTGMVIRVLTNPSAATQMTQGTGINQYNGLEIDPQFFTMYWQVTNGDSENTFTVIIFQTDGPYAPILGTMTGIFQSVGNVAAPLSLPDTANNDKFTILYRETFSLSELADPVHVGRCKLDYRKMKKKVHFSDSAGTNEDNDLYIGLISDSSAAANPAFVAQWRLHYST